MATQKTIRGPMAWIN